MVDIYEYGSKIKKEIDEFLKTAGVESYELSNAIKQAKEDNADFRKWAGDKEGWYEFITDAKDVEAIDRCKDTYFKIINSISKRKREEKVGEEKKNTEWWKENNNYWKESNDWWKRYKNNELDWQKDQKKRDEENKKQLEESEKNRDEKHKKEFIAEVEMELIENNVSDERLSKKVGVSDWREKIRQADGFSAALSMKSSLKKLVWSNLKNEFTCANCGVKKEEYTANTYKGQKCCSYECEKELKEKNKGIDKDEAKEIKKELQEIKDYLKKNNNDAMKVLNNLLTWMKKGGVINITLSNDKMVVELSNKQTKTIEESDLTSEQRAVKNFLQSSSDKKSISQSEVEKMVGRNYNEEGGNKGKNGNAGIIAAIVVVVLVLVVVIGVVVNKNKKRDY